MSISEIEGNSKTSVRSFLNGRLKDHSLARLPKALESVRTENDNRQKTSCICAI